MEKGNSTKIAVSLIQILKEQLGSKQNPSLIDIKQALAATKDALYGELSTQLITLHTANGAIDNGWLPQAEIENIYSELAHSLIDCLTKHIPTLLAQEKLALEHNLSRQNLIIEHIIPQLQKDIQQVLHPYNPDAVAKRRELIRHQIAQQLVLANANNLTPHTKRELIELLVDIPFELHLYFLDQDNNLRTIYEHLQLKKTIAKAAKKSKLDTDPEQLISITKEVRKKFESITKTQIFKKTTICKYLNFKNNQIAAEQIIKQVFKGLPITKEVYKSSAIALAQLDAIYLYNSKAKLVEALQAISPSDVSKDLFSCCTSLSKSIAKKATLIGNQTLYKDLTIAKRKKLTAYNGNLLKFVKDHSNLIDMKLVQLAEFNITALTNEQILTIASTNPKEFYSVIIKAPQQQTSVKAIQLQEHFIPQEINELIKDIVKYVNLKDQQPLALQNYLQKLFLSQITNNQEPQLGLLTKQCLNIQQKEGFIKYICNQLNSLGILNEFAGFLPLQDKGYELLQQTLRFAQATARNLELNRLLEDQEINLSKKLADSVFNFYPKLEQYEEQIRPFISRAIDTMKSKYNHKGRVEDLLFKNTSLDRIKDFVAFVKDQFIIDSSCKQTNINNADSEAVSNLADTMLLYMHKNEIKRDHSIKEAEREETILEIVKNLANHKKFKGKSQELKQFLLQEFPLEYRPTMRIKARVPALANYIAGLLRLNKFGQVVISNDIKLPELRTETEQPLLKITDMFSTLITEYCTNFNQSIVSLKEAKY
jgi:hypothetical protein